jgi:hypothetical protein
LQVVAFTVLAFRLFTEIVIVVLVAHCPAVGVNVYKVVAALFRAGDQEPLIPLLEVVGNAAKLPPAQIGATGVKVGVMLELTTTGTVTVGEVQLPNEAGPTI